jgi:hypothetical protein
MKKFTALLLASSLAFSATSHAEGGWLDSVKSLFGMGEPAASTTEQAPSMTGMINSITENLGVTPEQAKGGLGSLMSYVKSSGSSEQFSALSSAIPGLKQVLSAAPSVSANQDGVAGLLNKAAEYNQTLKSINTVKQQFEALGLSPQMIASFIQQAKSYLDTPQGQQAKKLLTESLSKLV